jgi:hypothetical protein
VLGSAGGGVLYAWGSNANNLTTVPDEALDDVVAVSAGVHHATALLNTGEVVAVSLGPTGMRSS